MSDWEYLKSLPGTHNWPDIVEILAQRHSDGDTWAALPLCYWLARLMAEVGELAAAIVSKHEHPWEMEAAQIASLAINMLKVHGLPLWAIESEPKEPQEGTYYRPVVTNAPSQPAQVTFYPQEVVYTPGELSQYPSKTVGEP